MEYYDVNWYFAKIGSSYLLGLGTADKLFAQVKVLKKKSWMCIIKNYWVDTTVHTTDSKYSRFWKLDRKDIFFIQTF